MDSGKTTQAFIILTASILLPLLTWLVYQIYFHPLARLPGPKACCLSYVPYNYWLYTGRPHLILEALHQKYGPIIRVGPSTVSCASVKGMEEIYGPRPHFVKNDFYDTFSPGMPHVRNIISERDPEKHAAIKKALSRCFSSSEMKSQEESVQMHVRLLVEQLRRQGASSEGAEIGNLGLCFSSDTISDLAMGKSFDSLETGKLHSWPATIEKFFKAVYIIDIIRRYPVIMRNREYLLPKRSMKGRRQLARYAHSTVNERLKLKERRNDYVTIMGDIGYNADQTLANAAALVGAGSETVANSIVFSLYVLATNRPICNRLTEEIRNRFSSPEEITSASIEDLDYLNAVINETLRCYPPLPNSGYRVSPGAFVEGHYIPAGIECFTPIWTIHHSPEYFKDPYEFNPDRWLDPNSIDSKKAYAPFSLGPHGCIGKALALFEFRLALAHICWNFDFELVDSTAKLFEECKSAFSWIKPEIRLRFEERGAN